MKRTTWSEFAKIGRLSKDAEQCQTTQTKAEAKSTRLRLWPEDQHICPQCLKIYAQKDAMLLIIEEY